MTTKLSRVFSKLFGGTGTSSYFGKFGSKKAGTAVYTKDIATIQELEAFDKGIQEAVNDSNKAPFMEDVNGLFHLLSYFNNYHLQEGIPEYDTSTIYYIGSIVKKANTAELYVSLVDDNTGNALGAQVDTTNWKYAGSVERQQFKVGAFTRETSTASGNQSITGIGFKPRCCIFLMAKSGTSSVPNILSVGFDDGITAGCIYLGSVPGLVGSGYNGGASISDHQYVEAYGDHSGKINSLDSDGFTIAWIKQNTISGALYILYLALK